MIAAIAARGVIVSLLKKTELLQKNGGEARTSQSAYTQKNQNVSFQFQSTRQMERNELREYIRELENHVKRLTK